MKTTNKDMLKIVKLKVEFEPMDANDEEDNRCKPEDQSEHQTDADGEAADDEYKEYTSVCMMCVMMPEDALGVFGGDEEEDVCVYNEEDKIAEQKAELEQMDCGRGDKGGGRVSQG